MGPERIEALLQQTVVVAQRQGNLNKNSLKRVNVDTTVQPKAVAFPTDARLADTARRALVRAAGHRGIELRQSYVRVGKKALFEHSRYARARQFKRANRHLRKLRTYLGRVLRDIERKCPEPDPELRDLMQVCGRIHEQRRTDRKKVYSVHAPEVECIAKGKAHKKYEFGVKVSMATTSKDNWVVGAQALHGVPFDGHTLVGQLQQVERLSGQLPNDTFVDRGYRGAPSRVAQSFDGAVAVHLPKARRKVPRGLYRWMRRRSAIEPVIGHMKSDHRMERNPLKGVTGDQVHALLCAAGFNFRKLLRLAALWRAWLRFQALLTALQSRRTPLQLPFP
jgi:IS5 family transposase